MKKKSQNPSKRNIYTLLIVILSVLTLAISAMTLWIAHPTSQHRQTAQSITRLSDKALTSSELKTSDTIFNSKEYKDLADSPENKYTMNAGIATSIMALILSGVTTVFVYRYLRSVRVTKDPVSVTVWLSVVVGLITYFPGIYLSGFVTGFSSVGSGAQLIFSLIALPFAILISALFTYVVAKITDNIYNRSHGFIED